MMMKRLAAQCLTLCLVGGAASLSAEEKGAAQFENQEAKVSYSFGVILGKRMLNDLPDMNLDQFKAGLSQAFKGEPQLLSDDEIAKTLSDYQRELQQKQMENLQKLSEENKKVGDEFLASNKNKEGVVTLESGLQYKVLNEGKGVQPGPTDTVKVHYTGTLIDGTVFDSSVDRGEPVSFPVNGVIAGWTEALQLMPVGSKWQLFIPPELAYGPNGNRSIGPNETLLFEVDLLDVQK